MPTLKEFKWQGRPRSAPLVFVLEVAIGAIACVGTIFVDLCLDRCWVCKVAGTYEGALFLHAEVTTAGHGLWTREVSSALCGTA